MTTKDKQNTIDEQLLLSAAKSTLEESLNQIDDNTLDRLAGIRRQAIEAASQESGKATLTGGSSWLLPLGGAVTAAVMVVSVMLWSSEPVSTASPVAAIEDINLLTDSEGIEFYQDLEFYQWLAVNEQTVS